MKQKKTLNTKQFMVAVIIAIVLIVIFGIMQPVNKDMAPESTDRPSTNEVSVMIILTPLTTND